MIHLPMRVHLTGSCKRTMLKLCERVGNLCALLCYFVITLTYYKICVFDSSVERKIIRKYMEALLSGCVVAADLPLELHNELKEVMIVLRVDMNQTEINTISITSHFSLHLLLLSCHHTLSSHSPPHLLKSSVTI